jgi:SAM-dependent methyltransferase
MQTIRKEKIREWADKMAKNRTKWINKNKFFYKNDWDYMKFLISPNQRVLELGCGSGNLLNELKPSYGVGVDISANMVKEAKKSYPHLEFLVNDIEDPLFLESLKGTFDVIILSDTIGYLEDCETFLTSLHSLCDSNSRVVISYFSWYWSPLLKLAELLKMRMPSVQMNWLRTNDTIGFLHLTGFETVKREWRQLFPFYFFGITTLLNRFVGTLPLLRRLSLRNYIVARPLINASLKSPSATVLIPCKNEIGNIENAIKRIPNFCEDMEILYVDGHSQDGTLDEIKRVIKNYPEKDIKALVQDGDGKGDAVQKGFSHARGEVLMILDADLTVPPEDLPKFYDAIVNGKGEYINGTRLVYPMDKQAMRFLNYLANHTFSMIFSWLLNQRLTDTLCGTKVITKENYKKIAENRAYFGYFDPFGDFDLIFGASKLNLKIVEVPIRYAAREYGVTQISRFRHGFLLLRMVLFAYRKLKAF